MCIFTFAGSTPSALAAASRSGDCIWVPRYRSQPSARTSARQLSGSIGECARYGSSYSTSSLLAAPANAPARVAGRCARPRRAGARAAGTRAATPRSRNLRFAPSSHSTFSASRPRFAAQVLVAYTTTPAGICFTSTTPATARAAVSSISRDLRADHRRPRDHREHHARHAHVEAEFRAAIDLHRRIEPLLRLAEVAELRRILERDFLGHRQRPPPRPRACRNSACASR